MTTTYLITGSAGFIGSNLCNQLLIPAIENDEDTRIIGVDNLGVGSSILNIPGFLSTKFTFIFCDINNINYLDDIFSEFKPNIVFHLAAETCVDRSISSEKEFWNTNINGTLNVMKCSMKSEVEIVINQITDELFPQEYIGDPSLEIDRFSPTSPYACSKAAQYFAGRSYLKTHNLPIISTFPSNTFGPRQWPEKLIPKFILKLHRGEKVPLMKSIHNQRDWLAVDDHCRALIHLSKYGTPGEDYNIGAGNFYSNMEITEKLLSLTGRGKEAIELIPDRKAHDKKYSVDWNKIKKLGWRPIEKFDDYLKKTVEWYIEQSDTYPKEL